jgi:hypothetical protein
MRLNRYLNVPNNLGSFRTHFCKSENIITNINSGIKFDDLFSDLHDLHFNYI